MKTRRKEKEKIKKQKRKKERERKEKEGIRRKRKKKGNPDFFNLRSRYLGQPRLLRHTLIKFFFLCHNELNLFPSRNHLLCTEVHILVQRSKTIKTLDSNNT